MTENVHDLLNAVGTIRFEFGFLFLVFPTYHNFDCSYLGKHFSWVCNCWKIFCQHLHIGKLKVMYKFPLEMLSFINHFAIIITTYIHDDILIITQRYLHLNNAPLLMFQTDFKCSNYHSCLIYLCMKWALGRCNDFGFF